MATTSLNFSSQKISFVNKISVIMKATLDDEDAPPGYLYKEINDISFESVGYSESLVEFLLDRLKSKSCHVKFKVLKLMKHVTENGSTEFKLGLRKHSDVIKECTKYGGPPHPIHGNVPYVMVRSIAKELCEKLYSMNTMVLKSPTGEQQRAPEPKYGGMGPGRTGGSIQGFGNTPTTKSKGFGETILDEIEKLGAKMSETPADRQAALLAKLDLSGSTSHYQPPVLSSTGDSPTLSPTHAVIEVKDKQSSDSVKKPAKKHQSGKPGGGWNDDDDDDIVNTDDNPTSLSSSQHLSIETDSLADPSVRLFPEEAQVDYHQESELIVETLKQGSTGAHNVFLAPSAIKAFQGRCAGLSCDMVVEILTQQLASKDAGVVIRTLQLLEGIVYNKEELVSIDLFTATCKDNLVTCYKGCQSSPLTPILIGESSGSGRICEEHDNFEKENKNLWPAVKAKAAKIILILQQLSSHKNILPAAEFADFLPCNTSMTKTAG